MITSIHVVLLITRKISLTDYTQFGEFRTCLTSRGAKIGRFSGETDQFSSEKGRFCCLLRLTHRQ